METTDRRLGRTFLTALAAALSIVIAVAGTLVVTLAVQNRAGQEVQTRPDLLVLSKVTNDTLIDEVSGRVEVLATTTVAVSAAGVVTRSGIASGGTIEHDGGVVATIDETPIFAFTGQVPAYRALGVDAEGADVLQLQKALNGLGYLTNGADGVFGEGTALALYKFFLDRDVTPLDTTGVPVGKDWKRTGVPLGRVVFLPGYPATATGPCGTVGQKVSGELCSFAVQPTTVALEVSSVDASRLVSGMKVLTNLEGLPEGTLGTALPPVKEEDGDADSAAVARFTIDTGGVVLSAGLESPGRVVVAHSKEAALRVEGSGVRDGDASANPSLLLADGRIVPIQLDICAGGYCTFFSDSVIAGADVVLSGSVPEQE